MLRKIFRIDFGRKYVTFRLIFELLTYKFTNMLDQKIFINQTTGQLFSTVTKLSPQLEIEAVFDGKEQAENLRIYLDAEKPGSYGPDCPCVRIEFGADGKTVVAVSLLNDPDGASFEWKRQKDDAQIVPIR